MKSKLPVYEKSQLWLKKRRRKKSVYTVNETLSIYSFNFLRRADLPVYES